jgi:DNA-binding NarL/FixJ family response regulator
MFVANSKSLAASGSLTAASSDSVSILFGEDGASADSQRGLPSQATHWTLGQQEITVFLLDGAPLTRESLSISINHCDRGLHVLTAASLADVRVMLQNSLVPDVVVCNIGGSAAGRSKATELLRDLIEVTAPVPLIAVNDDEDIGTILEFFRLGVRGYIPTTLGLSVVLEAIRLVGAGGTFIPAAFLQALMRDAQVEPAAHPTGAANPFDGDVQLSGLTARQRAVLHRLREGKANKIIAHELGMRESTVKVHVRNILRKLGASNRTQAVYIVNRICGV